VSAALSPFVKLAEPGAYVACPWELHVDAEARAYWLASFKRHIVGALALGVEAAVRRGAVREEVAARADACREAFVARFDAFGAAPERYGAVTILTLDRWRDEVLRGYGFVDVYIDLKERENERMLPVLPEVCRRIDAMEGEAKVFALVTGVFAGNIFDMGSEPVAGMFVGEGPKFETVRQNLRGRPWLMDDYDALARRLVTKTYRKVVYFVDNAGSDFLLGAVPFVRHLAMLGTEVVVAANERPTLNDMTVHDIRKWWPRVLDAEGSLRGLPIRVVSTGTGEPLIDLTEVSGELNEAAADADLVVLEGMGRGVESNLYAQFSCDALNIAMVKDPAVARHVGGQLFDLVCRFR
jgi:uncharacterized protein with ATP-grasp and redox domains